MRPRTPRLPGRARVRAEEASAAADERAARPRGTRAPRSVGASGSELRVVRALRGMRRVTLVAAVAVLAVAGGSARADVFEVAPESAALPLVLPSAGDAEPAGLAAPARGVDRTGRSPRRRSRIPSSSPSGVARAPRTASRGRCSPRSTRSSRTSAGTWARARRARSAGCSSCPTPGCAGAPTRTVTASPTPGTRGRDLLGRALSRRGGRGHRPRRGVFAYNHAQWYVDDVLDLAALFGRGAVDIAFTRPRLRLEDGQEQRGRRGERGAAGGRAARADAAPARVRRSSSPTRARHRAPLRPARGAEGGPSRRVAAVDAANRVEVAPQLTLGEARARARGAAAAASFAPFAAALLGRADAAGSYVFPVGGGPYVVSVSTPITTTPRRTSRPPKGAPLFALADASCSLVDDSRCGIGFTLQTADGLGWTYCHLAYLDADRGRGAALAAGCPSASSARRPLHRPAPAPRPRVADALPAGQAMVPGVRRHRVPLAGRADRPVRGAARLRRRSVSRMSERGRHRVLQPLQGAEFRPFCRLKAGMTADGSACSSRLPCFGVVRVARDRAG